MKLLKVAFRHLLKHCTSTEAGRFVRGNPWCCGEHSNIQVRQPRTAGYGGQFQTSATKSQRPITAANASRTQR